MERRGFLSLALRGLAVSFVGGCSIPAIPSRPEATLSDAVGWISFAEGRYLLSLPRAELGQNIATGLKRVACTELGVGWDEVTVSFAPTSAIRPYRATVGSESIQDFAVPLAQACATLRDRLSAGDTLGQIAAEDRPYDTLRAFKGPQLVAGEPHQFRQIVTGSTLFASDIRLEGMLFGRVLRAPASPDIGARPSAWDEATARDIPGFVAVLDGDAFLQNRSQGLGIVAKTPGALDRIAERLAVVWEIDDKPDQSWIDTELDVDRLITLGDADHDLICEELPDETSWDIDLRFDIPLAAHASIEPRAAVADIQDQEARLWVGNQDPFYIRDVISDLLDRDPDDVTIHPCRVGGAFGGKTTATVEVEAAALSQAVGRPVKVQWTRAQELSQGFHRPQSSHRLSARLEDGRVVAWRHRFASAHVIFTNAVLPAWLQRLTDFIGDDGAARGAIPPYDLGARQIGFDLARLPVLTGPWRGLGAGPNGFAIESMIDECAIAAGQDPLQFRRDHVSDPRLLAVLDQVAADSSWNNRSGLGIACGIYKGVSYIAIVAEASFNGDEQLVVDRLWCAHECGRVIDPDQVKAQCEGNLMWGVGMAMSDGLTLLEGQISAIDFFDAPIPSIGDTPEMNVTLLESELPPLGAGETGIVAAAAAIANAARSLTGVRPTRLPIQASNLAE